MDFADMRLLRSQLSSRNLAQLCTARCSTQELCGLRWLSQILLGRQLPGSAVRLHADYNNDFDLYLDGVFTAAALLGSSSTATSRAASSSSSVLSRTSTASLAACLCAVYGGLAHGRVYDLLCHGHQCSVHSRSPSFLAMDGDVFFGIFCKLLRSSCHLLT